MAQTRPSSAAIVDISAIPNRLVMLIALLLPMAVASAQQPATIDAERPMFAISPGILSPGYLQVEAGFGLEQDDSGAHTDLIHRRDLTYPALLLRLGLIPSVELQAGGEYLDESIVNINGAEVERVKGLRRLTFGTKLRIRDEDGVMPEASFLLELGLPFGHAGLAPTFTAPGFTLSLRNSLTDDMKLLYSAGGVWDGINGGGTGSYGIGIAAEFTPRASGFVELHGRFAAGRAPEHSLGAGIACRLSPNVQLDLSGGKAVTRSGPDSYLSFGLAFRLPKFPYWIEER